MKLIEFFNNYPNEAECRAKFKEIREIQGVVCKKCKVKDELPKCPQGYNYTHYVRVGCCDGIIWIKGWRE